MHCDMYVIRVTSDHIFITKSSVYEPFVCPLCCAYCALKALLGKPTNTFLYRIMSMSKTKSTEIANCLLLSVFAYFCGLCAYFEGFLRKFVSGLHNLGINTLEFLHVFTIRREKLQCTFFIAGHAGMVGRVSRNNVFCVWGHVWTIWIDVL